MAWDIVLRFATLEVQVGRRSAHNEMRTLMSKKCTYGTNSANIAV